MSSKIKGFTLLELLVVVTVIALIAATLVVALRPSVRIGETNDSQRKEDIVALVRAIELYAADNNGSLPSDFSSSTIATDQKFVICNAGASRTCGVETRYCLQVDDTNFLGTYIPSLPYDPTKTDASDTGYYLTRGANNTLEIGACSTYQSQTIEIASRVFLPTYTAPVECGDGVVAGGEVCDYTGTDTYCPKGPTYYSTGYVGDGVTCAASGGGCNSTCSACLTGESCTDTSCGGSGILSDGVCYYEGGVDQTCNTVCSGEGYSCLSFNWNDDSSCTLMKNFWTCSSCSSIARTGAPFTLDEASCYYRNAATSQSCSATPFFAGGKRLCACDN